MCTVVGRVVGVYRVGESGESVYGDERVWEGSEDTFSSSW